MNNNFQFLRENFETDASVFGEPNRKHSLVYLRCGCAIIYVPLNHAAKIEEEIGSY